MVCQSTDYVLSPTMLTVPMVAQTLGVFCCLGITFAVLPGLYGGILFSWHPLLMSLGYLGEETW